MFQYSVTEFQYNILQKFNKIHNKNMFWRLFVKQVGWLEWSENNIDKAWFHIGCDTSSVVICQIIFIIKCGS